VSEEVKFPSQNGIREGGKVEGVSRCKYAVRGGPVREGEREVKLKAVKR